METMSGNDERIGEVDIGPVAGVDRPERGERLSNGSDNDDGTPDVVVNRGRPDRYARYVKPTQDEIAERVNYLIDLISEGKTDGQMTVIGKAKWDVSTRTIATYLTRAREKIANEQVGPKYVNRLRSLAVYSAIVADPDARDIDRIKAQERIDKLLGLEQHESSSHRTIEITGKDGGPITSQSTVVTLDLASKLSEFAASIRSAVVANAIEGITTVPVVASEPIQATPIVKE